MLLLAQICTKSFVSWGFAPDPTGGAYSAPPNPLAGLGGGAPGEMEGGWGEEGGEGKGREGVPECPNPEIASLFQLLHIHIMLTTSNAKTQQTSPHTLINIR